MSFYRNTILVREERAADIALALEQAQQELTTLRAEAAALGARWDEATRWAASPPAATRFRLGLGLGAGIAFLSPFLFLTLLAGAGVPFAALMFFHR